jgi:kumamolisin
MQHIKLKGTKSAKPEGAHLVGDANPEEIIQIIVELRRKQPITTSGDKPLSLTELESEFGARQEDIESVHKVALENDLKVVKSEPGKRQVTLRGSLGNVLKVFPAQVKLGELDGKVFRCRTESQSVPAELGDAVVNIRGIDSRSLVKPHLGPPAPASSPSRKPREIAKQAGFIQGGDDGQGATVAILVVDGGFSLDDVAASMEPGVAVPQIVIVPVMGTQNDESGSTQGHLEAALDIQIVASIVPKAKIVAYVAKGRDFITAIKCAIFSRDHRPTIVAISFGSPECGWSEADRNSINWAFEDAAAMGIACLVSSGDRGAAPVEFPGSSSFVTACGGTQMEKPEDLSGKERVWNDKFQASGGGFSPNHPLPSHQIGVVPGQKRGVPDVAGYACTQNGYRIIHEGQHITLGATSAVVPLYAGLLAGIAKLKLLPKNLNDVFYSHKDTLFTNIKDGDNMLGNPPAGSKAGEGWDPCTGLGVIKGDIAMQILDPLLQVRHQ